MKPRSAVPSSFGVLLVIACLCGAALAQDAPPLLTHHIGDVIRNAQAPLIGYLPATKSMRLVFVLPLRNQDDLESFLSSVYDPYSSSYRQFLTVEQFTASYGPTQQDYDAVSQFVKANGLAVVGTSRNRLNLDVEGSVSEIEKALNIRLGVYQHPTENRTFYSPDREPRPALNVQLWHVSGLDNYSTPHPMLVQNNQTSLTVHSNATTGSCPGKSFCGSDLRAAYYGGTALTGAGQSLGLFELVGTDLTDLTTYYKNTGQVNDVPITLLSVDGQSTVCKEPTCDDTEQTIDMTQALGMAPGMSSLVMYIGKGGLAGQSVDDAGIFNAMATAKPLDAQLSCSWAWTPADPNTDNPYFKEFAAQGQNLFAAAGDSGDWASAEFVYPADDVFITSVGGTDLKTTGAAGTWSSETAWKDSGGGISPDKFAIPSWQMATATGCADCSETYRNGPDVSANANFSFYVCADQTACTENLYGGTSFAAPMWAGYLALTNQQAVANGQSPLGSINPALYTIGLNSSYATDFHDITSGCQENKGFCATTGYDLVTGWGSPNGDSLITALASTASPRFTISASPNKITIAKGSSGTSTITTAISGGFDAAITLSSNLKTANFSPATIAAPGSGTSTMTIKVLSNAGLGEHTITLIGRGGGVTEATEIEIDVTN
jgi:subtilase family serine protease